jgi:hypothetical protein
MLGQPVATFGASLVRHAPPPHALVEPSASKTAQCPTHPAPAPRHRSGSTRSSRSLAELTTAARPFPAEHQIRLTSQTACALDSAPMSLHGVIRGVAIAVVTVPRSNTLGLSINAPCSLQQVCSGHGDCVGLPGFCSCRSGFTGAACNLCAPRHIRVGSVCTFLPGALTSCGDGIHNGNEEGVDCGGPNCGACSDTPLRPKVCVWVCVWVCGCVCNYFLCKCGVCPRL